MADVLYVLLVVAGFGGLAGLIRVCDRIIGPAAVESADIEPVDAEPVDAERVDGRLVEGVPPA
jgi:hypothetical protein